MVAAVAALGAWCLFPSPARSLDVEGYERIQSGMTQADVEAILGAPSAILGSGEHVPMSMRRFPVDPGTHMAVWMYREGAICAVFGRDGEIRNVNIKADDSPSFWGRVKRWFSW
jgi:hypothetical protein